MGLPCDAAEPGKHGSPNNLLPKLKLPQSVPLEKLPQLVPLPSRIAQADNDGVGKQANGCLGSSDLYSNVPSPRINKTSGGNHSLLRTSLERNASAAELLGHRQKRSDSSEDLVSDSTPDRPLPRWNSGTDLLFNGRASLSVLNDSSGNDTSARVRRSSFTSSSDNHEKLLNSVAAQGRRKSDVVTMVNYIQGRSDSFSIVSAAEQTLESVDEEVYSTNKRNSNVGGGRGSLRRRSLPILENLSLNKRWQEFTDPDIELEFYDYDAKSKRSHYSRWYFFSCTAACLGLLSAYSSAVHLALVAVLVMLLGLGNFMCDKRGTYRRRGGSGAAPAAPPPHGASFRKRHMAGGGSFSLARPAPVSPTPVMPNAAEADDEACRRFLDRAIKIERQIQLAAACAFTASSLVVSALVFAHTPPCSDENSREDVALRVAVVQLFFVCMEMRLRYIWATIVILTNVASGIVVRAMHASFYPCSDLRESSVFSAAFTLIALGCAGLIQRRFLERELRSKFLISRRQDQRLSRSRQQYGKLKIEHDILTKQDQSRSELLSRLLPAHIIKSLGKRRRSVIGFSDEYDEATILFCDICSFTTICYTSGLSRASLIGMLNELFSVFDILTEKHGCEKIKTIGDAYMVAAGIPEPQDNHAERIANLALDMREAVGAFKSPHSEPLKCRIGFHSGRVVAGVIGMKKMQYDVFGDSVNLAARMESHGVPGEIQCTEASFDRLKKTHVFKKRGWTKIKNRGEVNAYFLQSKLNLRTWKK